MCIDIVTVLPELLRSPLRLQLWNVLSTKDWWRFIFNLRDYTTNRQKSVDDYPYGAGLAWSWPYNRRLHYTSKKEDPMMKLFTCRLTEKLWTRKWQYNVDVWEISLSFYIIGDQRVRSFYYQRNLYWRLCFKWGELGALVLSDASDWFLGLEWRNFCVNRQFSRWIIIGSHTPVQQIITVGKFEVLTSGNFAKIDKWRGYGIRAY
jgi:tRNA (guanine37-N1)-methyltransferase